GAEDVGRSEARRLLDGLGGRLAGLRPVVLLDRLRARSERRVLVLLVAPRRPVEELLERGAVAEGARAPLLELVEREEGRVGGRRLAREGGERLAGRLGVARLREEEAGVEERRAVLAHGVERELADVLDRRSLPEESA